MPSNTVRKELPKGIVRIKTLAGHQHRVNGMAWSPDGKTLATASNDRTVGLWDLQTGKMRRRLEGHSSAVEEVKWSPDGKSIVSSGINTTLIVWDSASGRKLRILDENSQMFYAKKGQFLSPDGRLVASSSDGLVFIRESEQPETIRQRLSGPSDQITSISWSPDGRIIAAGSFDRTICVWDVNTGRQLNLLEGHTASVHSTSFSFDGRLLATASSDDTVRLWLCDSWEPVAALGAPNHELGCAVFHPIEPLLATLDGDTCTVSIWEINWDDLLTNLDYTHTGRYTNAKVILVGDSGVGKTGLGLVLTGSPFVPSESTHGRHVWVLEQLDIALPGGRTETREILLWDLAGQPGYRLIHQLHLSEVAIALIVFDARSETDPFAGVGHWSRALRQSQTVQGGGAPVMRKYLVAARTDRGPVGVSQDRVESLMREQGFDGYFKTSAKEGWEVTELADEIRRGIDWGSLPKVTSTDLFQNIKGFIIDEKQTGRLLSSSDELRRAFIRAEGRSADPDGFVAEFDTCVRLLESRDLVKRLSFGGLILLQPEMLDAYASAMVNAAKNEPDGLGCINEDDARQGRFLMPEDERIKDKSQEALLLIATVESLLSYEIALREQTERGPLLVFPSQLTRQNPNLPDPEGKAVVFSFEGPMMNIYATLAVRLSHSGLFALQDMWKNAIAYRAKAGGTCGMFLQELEEGRGELTLFFDNEASDQTRIQFEEYIYLHLQRRALPETIKRRQIIVCRSCMTPVTEVQAERRLKLGFDWMNCPVCGERMSLRRQKDVGAINLSAGLSTMDRAADSVRENSVAAYTLKGKMATDDFDVFLAHNSRDKSQIIAIADRLKERGIYPWLDKEQVPPGRWFQDVIQQVIPRVKSAAILIGKRGVGKWQALELRSFVSQCVERDMPVIPVLLPGRDDFPQELLFLKEFNYVRFSRSIEDEDTLDVLEWGITGVRPRDRRSYRPKSRATSGSKLRSLFSFLSR